MLSFCFFVATFKLFDVLDAVVSDEIAPVLECVAVLVDVLIVALRAEIL